MKFDAKTGIVLASSTIVGLVGDVLIYSLAESKGKKFGVHVPNGWALVNLIVLGITTGLVIDTTLRQIEDIITSKQEKQLEAIVNTEKEKISAGEHKGQVPTGVTWQNA